MSTASPTTALLSLLALALAAPAAASTLSARLIGSADAPVVDGKLDDKAWQNAPVLDVFHEYQPRNGNPAPEGLRTTVQLLIDDKALTFGIRARDTTGGGLRGSLTRRDKVGLDQDFIGIWIDPAGHGRAAQFVRINIAGILSDGMHRADDDESDLGPDFPIDSAVHLLPDGYSIELRWPLSSLRFPYAGGKNWRAMVERSVPHADGLLLTSVPLKTDALSFMANLQEVEGMGNTVEAVRDRRFLEIRPELTVRRERDQSGDGNGPRRSSTAALGVEINARPRADWVFNATLNPDYSQVEIDQPVSAGAKRIALSLPEKRGFFLESSDVLGLPLAAFYSRTVADPEWGLRATWRASGADATAMTLRDQEGGTVLRGTPYETLEYEQTGRTLASLLRTRWHGDKLMLGAFASQRDYGRAGSNQVAGVDAQWRGSSADGAQQQLGIIAMHSATSASFSDERPVGRAPQRSGSYAWGKYTHRSSAWLNAFVVEAISPGFVNDNGFVPQAGVLRTEADLNRVLGPRTVGGERFSLDLFEFEAHLGLLDIRTLHDARSGQPGNEIVERSIQPGIWFSAPRQTKLWANLGFDQLRGHRGGKLHDTPALHLGFESRPTPWLVKLDGELTLGRQLDIEADRVGSGGNVQFDVGLRFGLPRGWALELDHHVNRAWVNGTQGRAAFSDNGWRWLGILHFGPRDSLRALAQNTWGARRDDGVSRPEAPLSLWNERQMHRSLLYRHLWSHGRSMAVGVTRDKSPSGATSNTSATFKLQWEV